MDGLAIGLLLGLVVVLAIVAIAKRRFLTGPMTVAEKAEHLSKRRARMLPVLAVIYIMQQASYMTLRSDAAQSAVNGARVSAWLILSLMLLAGLTTKGFWLAPREVRDRIDDENTRANQSEAMRFGFIIAMLTCTVIYFITSFKPVNGQDAVHIVMSDGLGVALIRWGWLERVAHRDA